MANTQELRLSVEEDSLSRLRDEFAIPSSRSMKATKVPDELRKQDHRMSNPKAHSC